MQRPFLGFWPERKRMEKRRVEILAPAGSYESMVAAVNAGANAVYIGGSRFGARAYADNLDEEAMIRAIDFVHLHNCRIYMTVNTLVKEKELPELYGYLKPYYEAGLDAVLVQDLGVFSYIREYFPDLPLHISTQMTVTGKYSAADLKRMGAVRVVPAREFSLKEIREIGETTGLEVETFVHGALCYCYSGQCLFSSLIGGRSGNRGRCAQTCRLPFDVEKGDKVLGGKNEKYVLSLKDLCTLDLLPEILEAGVTSLKIEGRMKTALYVATVARTYRMAIDDYLEDPKKYEMNLPKYRTFISQCTYRQYTTGFFFGKPDETTQIYDCNVYERDYVYLGIVGDQVGEMEYSLEQKNKFYQGQKIEVMKADGNDIEVEVVSIKDEEGNEMESCPHPKQKLKINLGIELEKGDILRVKEQ